MLPPATRDYRRKKSKRTNNNLCSLRFLLFNQTGNLPDPTNYPEHWSRVAALPLPAIRGCSARDSWRDPFRRRACIGPRNQCLESTGGLPTGSRRYGRFGNLRYKLLVPGGPPSATAHALRPSNLAHWDRPTRSAVTLGTQNLKPRPTISHRLIQIAG